MQKQLLLLLSLFTISGILIPGFSQNKPTIIYLVRHAEKELTNPEDKNPPLSQAGIIRAKHLAEKLKKEKIDVIYSTAYLRTQSTVQPLAQQKNIQVKPYQGTDYEEVKKMIAADRGKTVLICGHSNNLIPIIEALGAKPPVATIDEDEYDNFFKVKIDKNGKTTVMAERYK